MLDDPPARLIEDEVRKARAAGPLSGFAERVALNAEDRFGMLLATGITGMYLFHVLVNIGMTAGIMPVTGVPLPFLSYGVSSLTTNMLLAGLLLNINLRKTRLQF